MTDICEKCATPLAETGAPIWESYCPNKECSRERDGMIEGMRRQYQAQIERQANALAQELDISPEAAAKALANLKQRKLIA